MRDGFSDRMGVKKENTQIQHEKFDDRTRIALINAIELLWKSFSDTMPEYAMNTILINVLSEVYLEKVDYRIRYSASKVLSIVYDTIQNDEYDDILTIVEYVAQQLFSTYKSYLSHRLSDKTPIQPYELFNSIFEKEFVGYRFVNRLITPITNKVEINEINDAVTTPYKQVNNHINKSLDMLSSRDNPDYENSIKESISAVECICSIIIGKSTTLGTALDRLEKAGLTIHPSMRAAFDKLYGYTSDGTGIRHSGKLGGPQSTFEEAKFMLVSCCAFVNYLIGVISKYKLK